VLAKPLNPLPVWQGVDFAYVLEVHESLADAESGTPAAERLFIKDATVAYVQGTGEFLGQLSRCKLGILQPWPWIHIQGARVIFSRNLCACGGANYSSFSDMLVFWDLFCSFYSQDDWGDQQEGRDSLLLHKQHRRGAKPLNSRSPKLSTLITDPPNRQPSTVNPKP
jgi:hypothetical protein